MKTVLRICLFIPILLFISCANESRTTGPGNDIVDGEIVIGPTSESAREEIPASGGTITIEDPSDPLDGFELTVPPNGFGQDQEIVIWQAEIVSHGRGENFNPISPLIMISYIGGYSEDIMTLKIPVELPDGYFAMGFFYDETTEKLEAIPVQSMNADFVTLMTRQLCPDSEPIMKSASGKSGPVVGRLMVSSVKESILNDLTPVSSGFTPGEDDWEFPNYGSYVSPGGHCAGQSMAAMWYYYEKKLNGEPQLNARYDLVNDPENPDLLWQDNPRGYRFSSTLQEDQNFDNWIKSLEWQSFVPSFTYYSFLYSTLITGEPQYVLIRNSVTGAGHAMVVYDITPTTGTLHIADPNYPNNTERTIEYQNGQLQPYSSAAVAGGDGIIFDQIGYAAKSTHIQWSSIATRWAEFENGTIGDDRFPDYTLWARNGSGSELIDGFETYEDTLKVHCRSTEASHMIPGTSNYQVFYVYNDQGNLLGSGSVANNGICKLPLEKGNNKLGFSIMGANAESYDNYVDFKWINVERLEGDVDFSRVDHVAIVVLSINTLWERHNNQEPREQLNSPLWSADVTFNNNVLSGKSTLTGDSIWVSTSPSSISYFGKSKQTLGSDGSLTLTISGTINGMPTEITDDDFSYEAEGAAACSAISSLTIDDSAIYKYLGYACVSNTLFSIRFEYKDTDN